VRMRVARPGINPVVEFDAAAHQTKYGRKMKPVLRIVGWVGGNLPGTVDTVPQPGGDYHGGKPALVPPAAHTPQYSDTYEDVPF
jgi:hypothetical protein